jgi:hypothetical protein
MIWYIGKNKIMEYGGTAHNRTVETGHALSLPEPERRQQPERYVQLPLKLV